jgi:hypothetical protein
MTKALPRYLLAGSATLLLIGGIVHALALKKAMSAIASSNLQDFYAGALKSLWLIDSATLVILAIVFGVITVRPVLASGLVVALLALLPGATAALLYAFIGTFVPAHFLLTAAILAFCGGLLLAHT